MEKQKLRQILGQLIALRESLKAVMATGLDWGKVNDVYDDLRHAIAELEMIIDN